MLKLKSKKEKLIEQVKKKKAKIDKLEEDIRKMVKMGIKDGKLVPTEDAEPSTEVKQKLNSEEELKRPAYQPQQETPQEQQLSRDELYNQMVQRQVQQEMFERQQQSQQSQQPKMQQQQQQYAQPEIPPQEFIQKPEVPADEKVFKVEIVVEGGLQFTVQVPREKLDDFIAEINTAMNEQAPFIIDNRKVVNGRHIIAFVF